MHFDLLFAHLERYVALTPAEKEIVRSRFTYQKIRKRQYLLQQNEICRADYFIVEGILRQYEVDDDGRENIVQFAMANWWITDWYSMQSGIPSIYNIDALENAAVLKIDQQDLEKLFVDVPAFNVYFRVILQRAYSYLQRRVLYMQKPADVRYREFRDKYARFEQQLSQQHIASYLGITRESLSRIRNDKRKV